MGSAKEFRLFGCCKCEVFKNYLKVEGNLISNSEEVAEAFNHYFISLDNKLCNQLPGRPDIYNEKQGQSFYGQCGFVQDSLG